MTGRLISNYKSLTPPWRDEALITKLHAAWKRHGSPRYWQAIFWATAISMENNPRGKLEPTARILNFQDLFAITPNETRLLNHGANIRTRFAERIAELKPT
jgi:hypothetical protein